MRNPCVVGVCKTTSGPGVQMHGIPGFLAIGMCLRLATCEECGRGIRTVRAVLSSRLASNGARINDESLRVLIYFKQPTLHSQSPCGPGFAKAAYPKPFGYHEVQGAAPSPWNL